MQRDRVIAVGFVIELGFFFRICTKTISVMNSTDGLNHYARTMPKEWKLSQRLIFLAYKYSFSRLKCKRVVEALSQLKALFWGQRGDWPNERRYSVPIRFSQRQSWTSKVTLIQLTLQISVPCLLDLQGFLQYLLKIITFSYIFF